MARDFLSDYLFITVGRVGAAPAASEGLRGTGWRDVRSLAKLMRPKIITIAMIPGLAHVLIRTVTAVSTLAPPGTLDPPTTAVPST